MKSDAPPISPVSASLAALCLPTILCVSAANNIILGNLEDVPYQARIVVLFGAGFCGLAAGLVPAFLWGNRHILLRIVARASILAGTLVVLFNSLSGVPAVAEAPMLFQVALDALVIAAAGAVIYRAAWIRLVPIVAAITMLQLAHGVGAHAFTVWSHAQRNARRMPVARHTPPAPPPDVGNVYHVVLDAFQTEAFALLRREGSLGVLEEFVVYPEFTSAYAATSYALPCTLNGRYFPAGGSMWQWREAGVAGGLWAELSEAGFNVSVYPYFEQYCSSVVQDCEPAIRVARVAAREARGLVGTAAARLTVDLWFNSLLPVSARRPLGADAGGGATASAAGGESFSLTNALWPSAQNAALGAAERDMVAPGSFATLSVRNFNVALDAESARPAHGQYVFLHLVLPHWPYMVDAACAYRGRQPFHDASIQDYLAQGRCALRLIDQLVRRLRALDRYDDALIVVHGDHGMDSAVARQLAHAYPDLVPAPPPLGPEGQPANPAVLTAPQDPWGVGMRSRALLAVKYPAGTSPAPAGPFPQLIDIAPTILHHAGLPHTDYPGLPLQLGGWEPREVPFFSGVDRLGEPGAKRYIPDQGIFRRFMLREGRWEYVDDVSVNL